MQTEPLPCKNFTLPQKIFAKFPGPGRAPSSPSPTAQHSTAQHREARHLLAGFGGRRWGTDRQPPALLCWGNSRCPRSWGCPGEGGAEGLPPALHLPLCAVQVSQPGPARRDVTLPVAGHDGSIPTDARSRAAEQSRAARCRRGAAAAGRGHGAARRPLKGPEPQPGAAGAARGWRMLPPPPGLPRPPAAPAPPAWPPPGACPSPMAAAEEGPGCFLPRARSQSDPSILTDPAGSGGGEHPGTSPPPPRGTPGRWGASLHPLGRAGEGALLHYTRKEQAVCLASPWRQEGAES